MLKRPLSIQNDPNIPTMCKVTPKAPPSDRKVTQIRSIGFAKGGFQRGVLGGGFSQGDFRRGIFRRGGFPEWDFQKGIFREGFAEGDIGISESRNADHGGQIPRSAAEAVGFSISNYHFTRALAWAAARTPKGDKSAEPLWLLSICDEVISRRRLSASAWARRFRRPLEHFRQAF